MFLACASKESKAKKNKLKLLKIKKIHCAIYHEVVTSILKIIQLPVKSGEKTNKIILNSPYFVIHRMLLSMPLCNEK